MYTDALLHMSDKQAVTTTAVSANSIDLGPGTRDIGEGKKLIAVFQVTTALAGGTSIEFQVVGSPNADLSGTPVVIGSSGAIATADARVGVGKIVYVDLNSLYLSTGYRYIGARYNIVGTYTGGAVSADITETVEDFKTYPGGFTVV